VSSYRTEAIRPDLIRAELLGSVTRILWETARVPGQDARRSEAVQIVDRALGRGEGDGG
jgi:hypothetical protein